MIDPPLDYEGYRSTALRHPKRPLIALPHGLTELSAPVLGEDRIGPLDNDLTRQHDGEPQGQRIIVHGRVIEEDGRPVPDTLVEVWQANAGGRYFHRNDNWPSPLDPNFTALGRTMTNDTPAKPAPDRQDDWLDEALEETFPASDPIAAHSFD